MNRDRNPDSPGDVTTAELAVLERLWAAGSATIREITDSLYPGGTQAQYATVQKLLERLAAKGWVAREKADRVHRYRPRADREALIGRRLRDTAEQLCEGSLTPLLTHLVRAGSLTADEIDDLRRLVEGLDRPRLGSRGPGGRS